MFFVSREGNKRIYADRIIELFPEHSVYIEPFLGTGAVYFNKPLAKYNFLNDTDKFIYNLWYYFKDGDIDKIVDNIRKLPIYSDILKQEKLTNINADILLRACVFMGSGSSIRSKTSNGKQLLIESINNFKPNFYKHIENASIFNKDYKEFINSIAYRDKNDWQKTFIYCDPPYSINKGDLKANKKWNGLTELNNLILLLKSKNCKFAISEMESKPILDLFNEHGLFVNYIANNTKTSNATNKPAKVEIMATNYEVQQQLNIFN